MYERLAPHQYDSLDDIPEPVENSFLISHEHISSTFAKAYQTGKMHHALMVTGPRGIGKATLAFHFAYHLFTYPDPKLAPETLASIDIEAQAFRLAARNAHPGLLHITRPYIEQTKKFRTAITVDEVRRIGRFLSMTPADGGWRVVLIDPADDMNVNAANALLKSLEEPPPRTLFILIAHSPGQLLPTIRSRCTQLRLQSLLPHQIEAVLTQLSLPVPDKLDDRQLLMEQSEGSVRNAILLTQFGGLEIASAVQSILDEKNFSIALGHKLADTLAGKDALIQFDLFNRMILDRITAEAAVVAHSNSIPRATSLALLCETLSERIRETETYNLDKKQHVLGILSQFHAAVHQSNL